MEDTKYLSPDHKIDATSCLFPESTWFVKNLHHDYFPDQFSKMAMDLMNNDSTVTGGIRPQFMFDNGKNGYLAVEGLDEDAEKAPDNPLMSMVRFFTQLFNMIVRFLKGEISFGEMVGKGE